MGCTVSCRFGLPQALAITLLVATSFTHAVETTPNGNDFFEAKIRPVLVDRCYSCHSAESKKVKGSLWLDTKDGTLKGGDTGPIITPGDPEKSSLIRALRYTDENLQMPPKERLTPQQVADFEAWVKMGAPDPRTETAKVVKPSINYEAAKTFWSFQPVKAPKVPDVKDRSRVANDIDCFLQNRIEAAGLTPAKRTDKRTLIRRTTYDLIGLPPTPEEIDAFEKDASPEAFAKVVDRLLASPHYGERWGRHWLDIVRYADTAGETADFPISLAYRYRNYVIEKFNQDMPYDQFIREQIAGDLIGAKGPLKEFPEHVIATGYLAIARRFGSNSGSMHLTIEDTLDTLGKSVLGLSVGCARCHDHKFDPISANDYYALYGFFSSTKFAYPGSELEKVREMTPLMPPAEFEKHKKTMQEALAPMDAELKTLEAEKTTLMNEAKARPKPGSPLASGAFDNGGQQEASGEALQAREVKTGEMLQLIVLPKTNHGADSTVVEFEITELGGAGRVWNLTKDIVPNLFDNGKANPHADSLGNAGVWYFYDALNGGVLFSKSVPDALKKPGLNALQNEEDTPSLVVNSTDKPLAFITVELPPKCISIHPSPKGGVVVAWQSPLTGKVKVAAKLADADRSGGDGIAWEIHQTPGIGTQLVAAQKNNIAMADVRKRRAAVAEKTPVVEKAFGVQDGAPANTRLQRRGDPRNLADEVPRHFLQVLGGQTLPAGETSSGRLQLAEWLTAPTNPLTARVMVNRIWQYHFGRGLVATPNDFGTRGSAPSHPELLEYLATKFVASGWSMKSMHRMMLLTDAYQRSSLDDPKNAALDHDNINLWRFNARRLDAEEIRDAILATSGELDRVPGGPHPFPPEESWAFTQHVPFTAVYETNKRSVYLMTQRIKRHPFLALFDGADPNSSTPERRRTTVPTQALYFMNDPYVFAKAQKFAALTLNASNVPKDTGARLDFVCRRMFGRVANAPERSTADAFLNAYPAELTQQKVPADKQEETTWAALIRVLFSSNEFVHID